MKKKDEIINGLDCLYYLPINHMRKRYIDLPDKKMPPKKIKLDGLNQMAIEADANIPLTGFNVGGFDAQTEIENLAKRLCGLEIKEAEHIGLHEKMDLILLKLNQLERALNSMGKIESNTISLMDKIESKPIKPDSPDWSYIG